MKKYRLLASLLLLACLHLPAAGNDGWLSGLERALEQRPAYIRQKEGRIDSLKRCLRAARNGNERLRLYDRIYGEYHTYRFDSAMYYVNLQKEEAVRQSNSYYATLGDIHRSVLLSTSGYFSESIQNLRGINSAALDSALRVEYYTACEWAYSMWAEYSNDKVYAPRYYQKEMLYQDSLLSILPPASPFHHYWKGENLIRRQRYAEAETCYKRALEHLPVNVRLYAMATYGLAQVYSHTRDKEGYEHYLVQAAISDQVCPLKENLALQELAFYLYQEKEGEEERANRFLNFSMEDALFYNNRLRMIEIAQKAPAVVTSYQEANRAKNRRLAASLVCISLLSLGLIFSFAYIYRQMRLLHKRKEDLAGANRELCRLNEAQARTNHTREGYVSLFMDLCAAYIDKLNRYQELVRRKVKAKQTDDLLKIVNATRLSETDAKEFFIHFDKAFLSLYPDFIERFNALLREGEEIVPKRGEVLNTELRIFALIRMGVKDSSKIATLLFYSPQTIYNHRSAVKGRAKVKEDFEKQVENLCAVL